jgi:hypothetical protein
MACITSSAILRALESEAGADGPAFIPSTGKGGVVLGEQAASMHENKRPVHKGLFWKKFILKAEILKN